MSKCHTLEETKSGSELLAHQSHHPPQRNRFKKNKNKKIGEDPLGDNCVQL